MSGAEHPRGPYASYIDVGKYLAKVRRMGLTTGERTVMYVLGNMANQDGICWPTQAYLMERTGASLKTLLKWLHGLRDLGWISYETPPGKVKTSCTYTVHPERGRQRTTSRSPLERTHRPPPAKKGPRKPVVGDALDLAPNGTSDRAIGAISDQGIGARSTWQSVPDESLQSTNHLEESTEEKPSERSYKSESSPSPMDSERARDLDKDLDHDHPTSQRRGPVWNGGVFLSRWESGYAFAHHPALPSLVIGEGHLAVARRKGLDPVQEVALFLATMPTSRNWPRAFMTWLERDDGRKRRLAGEEAHPPERHLIRTKLVELYFAGRDPMFPGEDRAFAPHHYDPACPCEGCELGLTEAALDS